MTEAIDQLDEYFAGERKAFDLPLDLAGSPLQKLVWDRLRQIPIGSTISYGELAGQIEESAFPAGLEPYQRVRAAAAEIGRTPTPTWCPATGSSAPMARPPATAAAWRGSRPSSSSRAATCRPRSKASSEGGSARAALEG